LVDGHREHEKKSSPSARFCRATIAAPQSQHRKSSKALPTSKSVARIDRPVGLDALFASGVWATDGGCDEYTEDEEYFGVGGT
jgi:hypothetical protein